ncbi:Mitochondrial ATPase [Mycena indigotica]|uniref:Mitochondrial ATPase n=1 Tax=Mycena indigotica TaxID=2126181 RepID=A0A8H6TFK7_9AGAR|nr:Mitochondrial ATPase [Mycena indigotica]KAF7315792.1 Mitochondrial ATPase [Mycena indigotica]
MPIDYTVYKGSANGVEEATVHADALTPRQVLVKITHAGICGTDEHYKQAPIGMGHEGVGTVQEIGKDVTEFKVGDVVSWGFLHKTCGRCEQCAAGYDAYCVTREIHGQNDGHQGAFGSHAIWDASILFLVPAGLAPEEAAPLMCGGATVFETIEESNIRATERVGVVGIGGLGHLAIQYLSKMGVAVVAFSTTESKREEALQLGASEFVVAKEGSEELKKIAPVNHLLVTSNVVPDWNLYLGLLKPRATIHLLTIDFGSFSVPAFPLVVFGLNLKGSAIAGRKNTQKALDFAARHGVKPVVQKFPMTKAGVEEGMAKLREGKWMLARWTLRTCARWYNSLALQPTDLLDKYHGLVKGRQIQYDEDQIRVVMQLRRLQQELVDYTPMVAPRLLENPQTSSAWYSDESASTQSAIVSLKSHVEELANLETPKGMLLTGPPGCGKSFLIDLWLSGLSTPYKTRKHYNQLVLEIYRGVWQETQRRMQTPSTYGNSERSTWDRSVRERWRRLVRAGGLPKIWPRMTSLPVTSNPTIAFSVAQKLVLRHWLLVFDEIQLLDISSATLLADVLSWFWRMGGVIVGTSNKVPDDIYKHGVQRERLEPFVEALKVRCPVLTMRSEQDWRRRTYHPAQKLGYWLLEGQESELDRLLQGETYNSGEYGKTLNVFGRTLEIPWSSGGKAKFTFNQLCKETLGPADYLTIAGNFHTIALTHLPALPLSAKNQARRFISLIDALYEARCRLICLAEASPEDIFFPDALLDEEASNIDILHAESVSETTDGYRPNVSSYDAPSMQHPHKISEETNSSLSLETLSIFSGQEEQFAFKRALSRLIEMTGAEYWRSAQWSPLAVTDRAWEGRGHGSTPARNRSSTAIQNDDDFASEANYADVAASRLMRPEAPRLKEEHMWGVRDDWGDGAKSWGRGVKAYERKQQ